MSAYYNEFDPFAAQWLRNLINAGLIAPGDVDTRSILDVRPVDLIGYDQCHFFAGIGGWSYACRLAGWPDERPIWTGSCPCQPFSAAGKRGGFDDERHLWPVFHGLIEVCRPPIVLGEQVASKDGLDWLDLVRSDLEGSGYAFGAADLCAAGVGAPHIRQRLWWVGLADPDGGRRERRRGSSEQDRKTINAASRSEADGLADADEQQRHRSGDAGPRGWGEPADGGATGGLADADNAGLEGRGEPGRERSSERALGARGMAGGLADALHARWPEGRPVAGDGSVAGSGGRGGLADAYGWGASAERQQRGGQQRQQPEDSSAGGLAGEINTGWPRPTNGFWQDADWLYCRDGKWRPVEPGTFPLAHGLPARVGRLRGYGNAIVPQAAAAFLEAVMEYRP